MRKNGRKILVSKSTFHELCDELRVHIEKQVTVMRSPVCVEKQVAICITCLMKVALEKQQMPLEFRDPVFLL